MTALDHTSEIRDDHSSPPTRRDFVTVVTGAFGAVGGAFALWPLIDQMNPNPGTPPPETRLLYLAPIAPGQTLTAAWSGLLVFIRHRTSEEIARARNVGVSGLPDPHTRNAALPANAPADDANPYAGRTS